jgi:hypothetical protein
LKVDQNEIRLEMVRAMMDLLALEEKVDRAARQKIRRKSAKSPKAARSGIFCTAAITPKN